MTEDKTKLLCLEYEGIDGKKIYTYKFWLDGLKLYKKRIHRVHSGPQLKRGRGLKMTGRKKKQNPQRFV